MILDNGEEIGCDLLLVGIGVAPEIWLAEQAAGLAVGNGIVTNYDYATIDANIFAIGDNVLAEGRGAICIESIHNAQYGGHYIGLVTWFTGAPNRKMRRRGSGLTNMTANCNRLALSRRLLMKCATSCAPAKERGAVLSGVLKQGIQELWNPSMIHKLI